MATYATQASWTPNFACPHSEGKGVPVCWDCTEAGHIYSPSTTEGESGSPPWDKFRKVRTSLRFRDAGVDARGNASPGGAPFSALEVHPSAEGLEVKSPSRQRISQPGLIVVTEPHVQRWNHPGPPSREGDDDGGGNTTAIAPEPAVTKGEEKEKENAKEKIWIRRRTLWIIAAIAIIALIGAIIGIAVGVTRRNGDQYASISDSRQDNGSSTLPPTVGAETASSGVAGDPPASATLSGTPTRSSSSHRVSSVISSSKPAASAAAGGEESGGGDSKLPPPPPTITTTMRSQPTTVTVSIPSRPSSTSSSSSPPPPSKSPHTSSRDCLGDEGATYTDPGTGSRFRIECAVSHEGRDIRNVEAETMEDCVSMCAQNSRCRGAVWFNVGPQGTDLNYCWLKSDMYEGIRDTSDAQSVVKL